LLKCIQYSTEGWGVGGPVRVVERGLFYKVRRCRPSLRNVMGHLELTIRVDHL